MANISGNIPWGNSTQAPFYGANDPNKISNNASAMGQMSLQPEDPLAQQANPVTEPPPINRTPYFAPNSWESYSTRPRMPIRTYQADTADLMRSQPMSLAHITITEQSRGTSAHIIRNVAPARAHGGFVKTILYSLISVLMILGAFTLLILGLSQYKLSFLGPGINNIAENYSTKIYNFLGITKTPNPGSNTGSSGNSGTRPPVFGNSGNTNTTGNTGSAGTGNPSTNPANNTNNGIGGVATIDSGLIVRGIIKVDYGADVTIQRGTTLAALIQGAKANRNLKTDQLLGINVYNPNDNGTTPYLTSQQMLVAIASRAPDSIRKALDNDFVIGYSGPDNTPYLILTTKDFAKAFAGMLAWETSLYDDFATIFSLPIDETASSIQRPAYNYKDGLILSRDVRILSSNGNKPPIYYSFVDKNTILITTSDVATKRIIEKLDLGAYIRQK